MLILLEGISRLRLLSFVGRARFLGSGMRFQVEPILPTRGISSRRALLQLLFVQGLVSSLRLLQVRRKRAHSGFRIEILGAFPFPGIRTSTFPVRWLQFPMGGQYSGPDPPRPHGGVRHVHQKSTCLCAIDFMASSGAIWSRSRQKFEAVKPSNSTVWVGVRVQG